MQSEHQKIINKTSQQNKVIESRRYTNSDRTQGFIVGQEIYSIRDMPSQNAKKSYEEITFRHNNTQKVTETQKAPTMSVNVRRFSLANNNNQIDKSEEQAKNNLLEESDNYNRNLATISHNQEVYGGKYAYLQTELSAFGADNSRYLRRYDKRDRSSQQQGPIISSKNFASLDNSDQRVLTKLRERLLFQQVQGSKISNNARACSQKQLFVNRRQKIVSKAEQKTEKISLKPKRLYMCPIDGYSKETNEIKKKKSKLWLCRKFQLKKWIQEDLTREEYKYCNLMKQMGGLSAINNINSDFGRKLKTNISNHSNTIDLNQKSYEDLVISNKKSSLGQIKQQKIKYNQRLKKLSHPKKDRAKSTLVVLADEPDNINQKISAILTRIRQKRKDLDSKDIIEQTDYSNSYLTVKLKTKSSSSLKQKNISDKITPIREERLIKTEAMSVAAIDTSIKVYSNSQKSKQIKELMSRERPSVKINWHQMHVSK